MEVEVQWCIGGETRVWRPGLCTATPGMHRPLLSTQHPHEVLLVAAETLAPMANPNPHLHHGPLDTDTPCC